MHQEAARAKRAAGALALADQDGPAPAVTPPLSTNGADSS